MTAELPINLAANPRLSRWLRFDAKGFVEVSPGKIEIGQGAVITASITMEAVKELKLKVGDKASAIIKASDVIVGKE